MTTKNTGWEPKEGARVRVLADPKAPDDEAPPPPGIWMCLSRAPDGPTWWWLLAIDTEATDWCRANPGSTSSKCITRPNRHLAPVNTVRL